MRTRRRKPPGDAGFEVGQVPVFEADPEGEGQETGEPPGDAGFEAEVAHPKDMAKVKGVNQEKGEPPGGAGFEAE